MRLVCPRACSGAMYSGVPVTTPVLVTPGRVDLARDAEVGDVGVPAGLVALDEDVGRLDVAMHQPLAMRGVERVGHVADDGDALLARHLLATARERLALDELQRDERQLVRQLADAVDLAHVGVLDARLRARLVDQPRRLLGRGLSA